jgi:hypothetical protein
LIAAKKNPQAAGRRSVLPKGAVSKELTKCVSGFSKTVLEQHVDCYLGHEKTTSHIGKYLFKSMTRVIGCYL